MSMINVAVLLLWASFPNAAFKIDRHERDITHGLQCFGFSKTEGSYWSCTCMKQYTTMMSDENEEYDCKTPKEVGCVFSLLENSQTYIVTTSNVNKGLTPIVTGKDITISNIFVWSYDGYRGHWNEITNEASYHFTTLQGLSMNISISNLDLEVWKGHVVKLELSTKKCVVLKIIGTREYPFDLREFNRTLRKTVTTMTSPTTASNVTTTISPHSIVTSTVPIASTLSTGKVTKSQTTTTIMRTEKKHQVTISTTLTPFNETSKGLRGANSTSRAIYVIVAIVIAIALGLVILFVYQRRKSKDKTCADDQQSKNISNKHPNISIVNNAYQPDDYNNSAARRTNGISTSNDLSDKTFAPFPINAGIADTKPGNECTGVKPGNHTPHNSSGNVYMSYEPNNESQTV